MKFVQWLLISTVLLSLVTVAPHSPSAVSARALRADGSSDYEVYAPLAVQPAAPRTFAPPACHFGIGVVYGTEGYAIDRMGFGSYLNWSSYRIPMESNLKFLPILQTGDKFYQDHYDSLESTVTRNPSALWIIGNEPDAEVAYQDHISAEVYAQRYYAMATKIRSLDSSAKLGFGSIIQATPIRRYYLDLALNKLEELAGSREAALSLIDVYTIHNFLLNEQRIYDPVTGETVNWGAGLPVGYDEATWPAPEVITIAGDVDETWKTYSIDIYKQRIIDFRAWMKTRGEQDKPLWVTEYGSLLPPVDIGFIVVSDQDTANFMTASFDFMLGYKDPELGYAADENRLVQHWVWWSLDEYRTKNGGSLYDPLTKKLTLVGERYLQYDPPRSAVPLVPNDAQVVAGSLVVRPYSFTPGSPLVNYRVSVDITNTVSTDYLTGVVVDLYDGDQLVGSTTVNLPRCSGRGVATFVLDNLQPGTVHSYRAMVRLQPEFGEDTVPDNNQRIFAPVTLEAMKAIFLPLTGTSVTQ